MLTNPCAGAELNIDGVFSENIAMAQMVGAEGCDEYSLLKASKPSNQSILCIQEERNLWLLGLSFLAIGAFVGSTLSCFISSALLKRGYCGGRRVVHRVQSSQLPDIDTALEDSEENII